MAIVDVVDVTKIYALGDVEVRALRGVSTSIDAGEFVAVMGSSGSGKSTLMNILGCLDKPTTGEFRLAGELVSKMDSDGLARMRNRTLGFVFQSFNLLSRTTALENVELPLLYADVPAAERHRRAREALGRVGLGERMDHHPNQLSGGQQQRVAIARALVSRPTVMFADEPTGNLDSTTSGEILELLRESVSNYGQTTVMVTHDAHAAAIADRILFLADGLIVKDLGPSTAHEILAAMEEVSGR